MRNRLKRIFVLVASLVALLTIGKAGYAETRPATVDRRIALVSDPHISIENRYRAYVDHFKTVIDDVNDAHVDAVLLAGDLTQSFNPAAAEKFNEMTRRFEAPFWCVAGNHDVGNKPLDGKPATVTDARIAAFEHAIGPAYFSKVILTGVRVIGITSSLFNSGAKRESDQWDFLQNELQSSRGGVTLLLSHYPPFAAKADEANGYFNIDLVSRVRLQRLLKQGSVAAILSGHLHRPITFNWDGLALIGAPATSFGLPEGKQRVGWTLVTIHPDDSITSDTRYIKTDTQVGSPQVGEELIHHSSAPEPTK